MSFHLPPDVEERVKAQLAAGHFSNEIEVLREALDTLEKRQRGLQQLREKVKEADADIAAGRLGPFNADDTKRAVRERLGQRDIRD